MRSELEITVIYDGLCEFCEQSVLWVQQKLEITAVPFQNADLTAYQLTSQQCAQQVYVVSENSTYGGADAIAFLLKKRGNTMVAGLLTAAGPVARAGYRQLAAHRNFWPVKLATKVLTFLNR